MKTKAIITCLILSTLYTATLSAKTNNTTASVGFYFNAAIARHEPITYISNLSASSWSVSKKMPAPPSMDSKLFDIACHKSGKCSAVGAFGDAYLQPLTYTSKDFGNTWSLPIYPPSISLFNTKLINISCFKSGKCVAVGDYYDDIDKAVKPLVYTSSNVGNTWQLPANLPERPSPTSEVTTLNSVSCSKAGMCTAVGHFTGNADDGTFNPIAYLSSDFGQNWKSSLITPAPFPEFYTNDLSSISCLQDGQCVAVGYARSDFLKPVTYASKNYGLTWSNPIFPPFVGTGHSELLSVSCDKSGACIAVGYSSDETGALTIPLTYISSDYGNHWKLPPSPPVSPSLSPKAELHSITCISKAKCIAVGLYQSGGINKPLAYWSADFGDSWSDPIFPPLLAGGSTELLGITSKSL